MKRRNLAFLSTFPLAATVLIAAPSHAVVPTCNGHEATIVGTAGNDHLTGTEGPDVVYLDSGNDTFAGKGGDDIICGGSGDDRIYPGAGNDFVEGDDGADHIFGSSGNDYFRSGTNNGDLLSYENSGVTDLRLDVRSHSATKSNGTDHFYGFGGYAGTTGADTLIGGSTNDFFDGNGGKDTIYGFAGDDHIYVTEGSPFVDSGAGNDSVYAYRTAGARIGMGTGRDTLRFEQPQAGNRWTGGEGSDVLIARGTRMEINLNQGFLKVYYTGAVSTLAGFENVKGTYGPDRIVGNSAANRLEGGGGTSQDKLIGLGGDDVLLGDTDDYYEDFADGGSGTDTCRAWTVINCEHRIPQTVNPYGHQS